MDIGSTFGLERQPHIVEIPSFRTRATLNAGPRKRVDGSGRHCASADAAAYD
jgi:hypothetical protein